MRQPARTFDARSLSASAFVVATALVAAHGAWAAEGRIPLSGPTVLDHVDGPISGKYFVTRNITAGEGEGAIRIEGTNVEDVEIDLNGFTLTSQASSVIYAENIRTLIIRNGISKHDGSAVNIRVRSTERLIVENVNATGGVHGIFVDVGTRAFIVRNNTITDVDRMGILASPALAQEDPEIGDGLISSNLILAPGERGIEARFGILSLAIVNNRIDGAGTYGITANSTGAITIVDNKVNGANYRGLVVNRTTSCRVSGNVVKGAGAMDTANGRDGIDIAPDARNCLVLHNASSDNEGSGIRVQGDAHRLEGNVANGNGRAGIHFTADSALNTFGRNTARDNGQLGALPFNCVSNPGGTALDEPDFCDEAAGSTNTSFGDNLAPGPPAG